jgi:recombination protein RecT
MTKTIDTRPLGAELEQVALDPGRKGIIDLIRRNKDELQKLLGDTLTVAQFETATMTYLRLNPKLVECNPYGIVGGLRLGAQLGLSLGPLDHFYLVPFKGEAVFILGYKGMVELAYRSGRVKRVEAHVVRHGDDFAFRHGSRAFLDYTPSGEPGERDRECVYALAELTTGGKPMVVLYPGQVERRMKRSASHSHPSSPWQTDTDAMWRKSAVRALQPWLPQTREQSAGLAQDEAVVDALTDEPGGAEANGDE